MAPAGGRRRRGLLRLQPRRRSGNRYARGPRRETGAAGPGLRLLRLILTAAAGGGRRRRRSTAQAPTETRLGLCWRRRLSVLPPKQVKPKGIEAAHFFMEGLSCSQQQAIGLFNRTHLLKIFEYDSQED
ncbi:uncharacterized protein LOC124417310 isoform X1 [Gallus gallus]|uniref:uncharacterized protein LOC124417310 isoform X1 n=1 Tax=Gallus gallus TaxID=9031 RepID=UPI001EFFFAF4|nr:uncharacterized protein LOC124417310 isoform X1 [Gallus gallus]XP_046786173.1 uncharacterized protein LOC124417310 isoform X1 [Gallus gallus]